MVARSRPSTSIPVRGVIPSSSAPGPGESGQSERWLGGRGDTLAGRQAMGSLVIADDLGRLCSGAWRGGRGVR